MIENIKRMRSRHGKEIEHLQKLCKHKNISDWMDYMWAPGHIMGRVKVCKDCGKTLGSDKNPGPMLQHSLDNPPRPLSEEEIAKWTEKIKQSKKINLKQEY